jgi:hypothetical protein
MGGFRRVQMGGLFVGIPGGLIGAEMESSTVMYNFGVGPRGGPFVYSILEGHQSNLLLCVAG